MCTGDFYLLSVAEQPYLHNKRSQEEEKRDREMAREEETERKSERQRDRETERKRELVFERKRNEFQSIRFDDLRFQSRFSHIIITVLKV